MEAPEIDEEAIRRQITEEFEERERIKIAQLEEEIRKAEQEKHEEVKGLIFLKKKVIVNAHNSQTATELTDEEAKIIQKSQEFIEFVDSSTKLVERALNEKYDFMKNYTLGIDVEK